MTKTEVREWLKRIREDVRDMEAALKEGDLAAFNEYAHDCSGAAAELEDVQIRGMR